jgi:hypothetical protein
MLNNLIKYKECLTFEISIIRLENCAYMTMLGLCTGKYRTLSKNEWKISEPMIQIKCTVEILHGIFREKIPSV